MTLVGALPAAQKLVTGRRSNDRSAGQDGPRVHLPQGRKGARQAETACHKASCPWFKKKRFFLPLALIVLMVIIQVANGRGDTENSETAKSRLTADGHERSQG